MINTQKGFVMPVVLPLIALLLLVGGWVLVNYYQTITDQAKMSATSATADVIKNDDALNTNALTFITPVESESLNRGDSHLVIWDGVYSGLLTLKVVSTPVGSGIQSVVADNISSLNKRNQTRWDIPCSLDIPQGWYKLVFSDKNTNAIIANSPPFIISNGKGAICPTVQSQQTIVVKQNTLLLGDTVSFVVSKYPENSASWRLRLECSSGVWIMMNATLPDGTGLTGELVKKVMKCNEDIVLNKDAYSAYPQPVTFVIGTTDQSGVGRVINITSKTFDSAGTLLNQSSSLITVLAKRSTDSAIKALMMSTQAYLYYDTHTQGGYQDACVSHDNGSLLNAKNELMKLSDMVVCKDSQTAWAMSAQLKSDPSQYWCVDDTASAVGILARNSSITSTSCK